MKDPRSYTDVANRIIADSGFSPRTLRAGQYDAIVNALRSGDYDIAISKGVDGLADITINDAPVGGDAESDAPACPAWIPAALCKGFGAVTSGIQSITGTMQGGITGAITDRIDSAIDESTEKFESVGIRVGLGLMGMILMVLGIGVVLFSAFKGPVTKVAKAAITKRIS
jgi:hypothetical protein